MPTPKRIAPWLTLTTAQGNAVQMGGLLGATILAWYAGREGPRGTRLMVASRLLAYFTEHASSHWLVGRAFGIRFTGYGLHGTSHPGSYPPGARWVFSHLPLLSARRPRLAQGGVARGARGDVRRRHAGDRDPQRRDPGLLLDARRPEGAEVLYRCEPVERAAALQRVAASRRGPAPGVAGAERAGGLDVATRQGGTS
jgi:hypothetical protein